MNQSVYQKESAILERWKKARSNYEVFCEDGILVESDWINASPKIVFLLKETYKHFSEIRGKRKWGRPLYLYIYTVKSHGVGPS